MKVRNWFIGVSSVGQAAVARFAEAELEDVREAAKELGYGERLTLPQVEEVLAALTDDDAEADEDEEETDDEGDDDADDEEAEDDDEHDEADEDEADEEDT